MKDKISNNPSTAELKQQLDGMKAIKGVVDFFGRFGIKNESISKAFEGFDDLASDAETLLSTPDQFNERFAALGWIAYESLNAELMKTCLRMR